MESKPKKRKKPTLGKPKYEFWSKVDGVELWQAIHLFYDQQPKRVIDPYSEDAFGNYEEKPVESQFDDEQFDLYLLAEVAVRAGLIGNSDLVNLHKFFEWAIEKGFPTGERLYSSELYNRLKNNQLDQIPVCQSSMEAHDNDRTTDNKSDQTSECQSSKEAHDYIFRKNARGLWDFVFKGEKCPSLAHRKGFDYIKILLSKKNKEISCLTLQSMFGNQPDKIYKEDSIGDELTTLDHKDLMRGSKIMDPLQQDIINKIEQINADIVECEAREDFTAINKLKIEMKSLASELIRKNGNISKEISKLNQRETQESKKPIKAVCKAIREARLYIKNSSPLLYLYLKNCITTGNYCIYKDHSNIEWHID
ncbi:MAG: hypothetical protein P4M12_11040 [Gammaproteobacteria bacterium]|nr:hypothetical protein [Gammaproteobacteria bacterium]